MWGGHEFREGFTMNDATDVSLETDRLEELLEVPAPAQPVVMIEYRSRGVPWWVMVPLLVVPPVLAVLYYRHSVFERFQAQVSDDAYRMQQLTLQKAAELPSTAGGPTPEPVRSDPAPGPAPVAIVAEVSTGGSPTPTASKPAVPDRVMPQAGPAEASKIDVTDAGGPPKSRVRSIFPSPFELDGATAGTKDDGGDSAGRPSAAPARPVPEAAPSTKVASAEEPPQDGDASGPREGAAPGIAGKPGAATRAPAAKAGRTAPGDRAKSGPALEPLPSSDEWKGQLAQESAKKTAEIAEAQEALAERTRVRRYEDRVKFHEELSQILAAETTNAGAEIDALAKRQRNDRDPIAYAKAKRIWSYSTRVPMAARANQIRALDIPESDILNFISDNLWNHMHAPGGARNDNELRMKAARLLLKCTLPDAAEAPPAVSRPSSMVKLREAGRSRPQ
jgi:hypothetical protein